MTSQVETNEGAIAPLTTKEAWETPRVTSSAVSEITYGGPTRGTETGGDIGPS
jgi:hypothetical protein